LLLLCDGGGSNACHRHVFKETLSGLADRLGLEIRVAHYPPYGSKHNPIEHRLFPHITGLARAWCSIRWLSRSTSHGVGQDVRRIEGDGGSLGRDLRHGKKVLRELP
jgi:hypothetical protein